MHATCVLLPVGKQGLCRWKQEWVFAPVEEGASRRARQAGLGRALEIILSTRNLNADQAQQYGTINIANITLECPFLSYCRLQILDSIP